MTELHKIGMADGASGDNGLVSCWSCGGPVDGRALFCHTCGVIQPPRAANHFARLGIEPSFDLDLADLERRYLKFQRDIHPDRFASKSQKEQAISLHHATDLNEAYDTLKNPVRRAEYLLALGGQSLVPANGETIDDPALLMETMELREALSESENSEEIDGLVARVDGELTACHAALSGAFQRNDRKRAATETMRLKYLSKFLEEARRHRARLSANP